MELFTYPMYQAYLELFDQTLAFAGLAAEKIPSVKKVSPIYWLIPPYKIHKEKERSLLIIREMQLEENDLRKLLLYFAKSTAWFYVSLAGLLNGIYITYEIFGKWGILRTPDIFFCSILAIVVLCILTVRYRLASKRKAR